MSALPHLIYRFNSIPIKIPASNFVDIDKRILKFMWRGKRPSTTNIILKEKNKVGGLTLPNLKIFYKAPVIKKCDTGEKLTNRLIEQNGGSRIDPHKCSQLMFDKGAKSAEKR